MIKDGFILLKTTGNETVFIKASSIDSIKGGETFTTVEYNGQKKYVQEKMDCVLRLIIEAHEWNSIPEYKSLDETINALSGAINYLTKDNEREAELIHDVIVDLRWDYDN